jgi:hypothetical protein
MSDLREHIKRMNGLEDLIEKLEKLQEQMEEARKRSMSLFEYQLMLIRRLGTTLYKLDLNDEYVLKDLPNLPYDSHLTKTPFWKRVLGNHSTYVEFDDSGSKTIS